MIRKILRSGDPKLRGISKPVKKIDTKVLELIRDLKDTLAVQKDPEGVALAAPQIGKNLRVFVVGYRHFQRVVINPEIIEKKNRLSRTFANAKTKAEKSREKAEKNLLEGCLSLPNYYSPLKRDAYVKLKYLDKNGKEVMQIFTDFEAQVVLHEIDHLNGILFIDRLLAKKKPLYKLEGETWEEVELL